MKKYDVTQQYARDAEKPLAEFLEREDAVFFIERKLLADAEKNLNLIYRLFEDQKLLKEFNKEKITCSIYPAQYAVGDRDLPNAIGHFKVSKDNSSAHVFAGFIDLHDAELFIEDSLTQNNAGTTYYIFENGVLMTQMDKHIKKKMLANESHQGKGQASSFQPTPFNKSPRPPGTPPDWVKNKNEEDEK